MRYGVFSLLVISTQHPKVGFLTIRSFLLIEHLLNVTEIRDSYVWNCRELVTPLTLNDSLAEGGLKPLTIGSMGNKFTSELPHCIL